jgi:hypothetical protein
MKRNMDTIRTLLLRLESLPMRSPSAIVLVGGHDPDFLKEGEDPDEIDYHLALLQENKLIECPGRNGMDSRIRFQRLTWPGHDFLDSIRDDEVWRKTKAAAERAGGWTVDLLKDLAKGLIKKQVEEYTGVKLP